MNGCSTLAGCGWVGLVLALGVAWPAAAQVREESLDMYGGTYAADCADPAGPRLGIDARQLSIERDGTRTTTPVQADSFTSYGAAPTSPVPPEYRVEFIGDDFSLFVFEDEQGLYVPPGESLSGHEALLGVAAMSSRFRRCAP